MVPHHLQYGKLACMTAFTLLNITENPVISMHIQYAPKVFKGIYIIEFQHIYLVHVSFFVTATKHYNSLTKS